MCVCVCVCSLCSLNRKKSKVLSTFLPLKCYLPLRSLLFTHSTNPLNHPNPLIPLHPIIPNPFPPPNQHRQKDKARTRFLSALVSLITSSPSPPPYISPPFTLPNQGDKEMPKVLGKAPVNTPRVFLCVLFCQG